MAGINIPAKTSNRITSNLKQFQPVIQSALDKDINESDTVTIVVDILAELFGYDKFHELTSEHAIRGTFCDLAVVINDKVQLLLEVKAIGLDLKSKHLRQAINYAANKGTEWVGLTNGNNWQIYRVHFTQPVMEELVLDFSLLDLTPRSAATVECLYPLTREGVLKTALSDYYDLKQATSRYVMGALMTSEPLLKAMRRELKRLSPEVKIGIDQIKEVLIHEVLKREVTEGEKAEEAGKRIRRYLGKTPKTKKHVGGETRQESQVPVTLEEKDTEEF